MQTDYLAEATAAEYREEAERHLRAQAVLAVHRGPSLPVWFLKWAFAPYTAPSRARSARSASGHSSLRMEKLAVSRTAPSAPARLARKTPSSFPPIR